MSQKQSIYIQALLGREAVKDNTIFEQRLLINTMRRFIGILILLIIVSVVGAWVLL